MKRGVIAATLALAATVAGAGGLTLPGPAPSPGAPEERYIIMSAQLVAQIQVLIEAQRREIERLREKLVQGGCS